MKIFLPNLLGDQLFHAGYGDALVAFSQFNTLLEIFKQDLTLYFLVSKKFDDFTIIEEHLDNFKNDRITADMYGTIKHIYDKYHHPDFKCTIHFISTYDISDVLVYETDKVYRTKHTGVIADKIKKYCEKYKNAPDTFPFTRHIPTHLRYSGPTGNPKWWTIEDMLNEDIAPRNMDSIGDDDCIVLLGCSELIPQDLKTCWIRMTDFKSRDKIKNILLYDVRQDIENIKSKDRELQFRKKMDLAKKYVETGRKGRNLMDYSDFLFALKKTLPSDWKDRLFDTLSKSGYNVEFLEYSDSMDEKLDKIKNTDLIIGTEGGICHLAPIHHKKYMVVLSTTFLELLDLFITDHWRLHMGSIDERDARNSIFRYFLFYKTVLLVTEKSLMSDPVKCIEEFVRKTGISSTTNVKSWSISTIDSIDNFKKYFQLLDFNLDGVDMDSNLNNIKNNKWKSLNPWAKVEEFEETVAEFAGSKYAVSVDNCTNALFLCLTYLKQSVDVIIPKKTYISVPQTIENSGHNVVYEDLEWTGVYQLKPYPIWDGATLFEKNMYRGGYHCLSFQHRKPLSLGKGGMILTDDIEFRDWARKARYEGRNYKLAYDNERPTMKGWNMYMHPEHAEYGIKIFNNCKDNPPARVGSEVYYDLTELEELRFFEDLFPPTVDYLDINDFRFSIDYKFPESIEHHDELRTDEEGPVCECVGENTNKALFEYFQKIIKSGIDLPVYVNSKNQVVDGWHRLHAYYYLGRTEIPIYRNKVSRTHGFCWKRGIEGKRRLRLKTW
jgi:hypothetical protein